MIIKPTSSGVKSSFDSKDCTVRAFANAKGIDYTTAHSILAKHGRVNNNGAYPRQYAPAYMSNGFELIGVFGTTSASKYTKKSLLNEGIIAKEYRGMTVSTFLENNPRGNYICIVRGHALAIVNGTIVDTGAIRAGMRITTLFKLKT